MRNEFLENKTVKNEQNRNFEKNKTIDMVQTKEMTLIDGREF